MKIIFLDFDGVLNNQDWMRKVKKEDLKRDTSMNDLDWWVQMIDPSMMARLNKIVEATEAFVVISSSWRVGKRVGQLAEILEKAGFAGLVIGKTPRMDGRRGYEIAFWLEENSHCEAFVILDDDNDMEPNMNHLIRTNMETGLQDEHVKRAIEMLRNSDSIGV